MKEIKEYIDKFIELLPAEKSITGYEAERRASQFLVACAHIANWRHMYRQEKIKATSMERAIYSNVLSNVASSKITESKIKVEADPSYIAARESLEGWDNDLDYLKTYYDIFLNSHIQLRAMAKEQNNV